MFSFIIIITFGSKKVGGMNSLPCCLVIHGDVLADIWKHLHAYNCLSDVCFCACSPPQALVPFVQRITNTNTDNEISDPACKADVGFGRHLGKMNRFSGSCCFIQTGQRRGESNHKGLSLEVAWVVLTGSLFRESCKDAIFWLTAIGVIAGDGACGLNVCSADGTLWAGGRTSSVLMAFRVDSVWGLWKIPPAWGVAQHEETSSRGVNSYLSLYI